MFTNKLKANGEKKKYTHKKNTRCTIYLLKKKKKYIIESMNIALIVHFTPQTLRKARGGGYVVSSSEMAGGKKEKIRQEGLTPCNSHWGREEKKVGGRGGVYVCWHFVDIQKRQDPVSKHLFRLKSEWAALKRATQSWVKCFVLFFFSSIPLSGRAPTSFSPI